MGNTESAGNKVGYHVLQIQPGSPATGLIFPFWDIIVGGQGQVFDKEDPRLIDLFKVYENQSLTLLVHSLKTNSTREVVIVPSSSWGGVGFVGISIRFCSFEHTLELVWRVLDVYVDSPASQATLCSRTDFIIGTPDHIFTDAEDFFNLVNANMQRAIKLYVYSTTTEDVRIVSIVPNKDWGGSGSLGCDIGYGYLHRIPLSPTTSPPGATKRTPLNFTLSTSIYNTAEITNLATKNAPPSDLGANSSFTNVDLLHTDTNHNKTSL